MEEIKFCKYNADNYTIDIVKSNASKMSILCAAEEESLSTTMTSRSKLVWLKDNEPSTYVELNKGTRGRFSCAIFVSVCLLKGFTRQEFLEYGAKLPIALFKNRPIEPFVKNCFKINTLFVVLCKLYIY